MKKLLTILIIILVSEYNVLSQGFTFEGIAYKITSAIEPYTVSVSSKTQEYTGDVVIPAEVLYEGINYTVTEIAGWAFYYNTGLTSITIPNSVKTIGPVSFPMCTGLKSISIPNSVISIGDNAFSSCSGLLTAEFGNSVTTIGINAFNGCKSLTSVSFGKALSNIGLLAFACCTSLVDISISPENPFLTVENNVLYNKEITKLVLWPGGNINVTIPNSVTTIGQGAFSNYTNLQSVSLPSSVTIIEKFAFNSCTGLKTVSFPNVITIGSVAFSGCDNLTSVTFPNSLLQIDDHAFMLCSKLTEIEIPLSVTTIGFGIFSHCEKLLSINVSQGNTIYSSFDGVLYNKGNIKLISCPEGKTTVVFPNTLRIIEPSAFQYCNKMANIEFPDLLKSIGYNAFEHCTGLATITCNAVTPPDLGSFVFSSVPKEIPLYVPIESIKLYSDADQWKDFVIIPKLIYVSFNSQGGTSISDINTSYNTKITEPITPTRTGYTFTGWFKEFACINAWNFNTDLVTTNTTLYAKWTINAYTVTLNTQGGSDISSVNTNYNTTITTPTEPSRTGYTFGGWYKENACINPWVFATDVVTSDITLYAKWTINTYTVTFNSQGGNAISSVSTNYNSTISSPATPTRTGFTFVGWYKESAGTNAWSFATDAVTSDIALYAKWTINTYTVVFNSQGGSAISSVPANYNSTITAPSAPTRTGYTFDGWYKEAGCFNPWAFASDVVTTDITLYAKWNLSSDIETISAYSLKLYPNPVVSNLTIEGENIEEMTVYSSNGVKVLQPITNLKQGSYIFNVDGLKSGIYFARIKTSGNKMTTIKFIKR